MWQYSKVALYVCTFFFKILIPVYSVLTFELEFDVHNWLYKMYLEIFFIMFFGYLKGLSKSPNYKHLQVTKRPSTMDKDPYSKANC